MIAMLWIIPFWIIGLPMLWIICSLIVDFIVWLWMVDDPATKQTGNRDPKNRDEFEQKGTKDRKNTLGESPGSSIG